MNYLGKTAQVELFGTTSLDELQGLGWMDPKGNVFSAHPYPVHAVWAMENRDILKEFYGIDIVDKSHAVQNLIDNRWIRVTKGGKHYGFEIKDLGDNRILNILGDKLFSELSTDDDLDIIVCGTSNKKCANFSWVEFIFSGERFYDYVQANIETLTRVANNEEGNNFNWYKIALTQEQFYEFYGYSGLSPKDLQENPILLYNMVEHLNYIREYYLNYFVSEIADELGYFPDAVHGVSSELCEQIEDWVEDFSYDDFEQAIPYFRDYLWDNSGIGGPVWAEIAYWADKLWKVGKIPQQPYSHRLMKHISSLVLIVDTIHSLQHNTDIALVDLPEQEFKWLGFALEVVKHIKTPYQASQLSGNRELIEYMRNQDMLQDSPTKGQTDIQIDTFTTILKDCLTEIDEEEAAEKRFKISNLITEETNTGLILAHSLKNIIDSHPYPSIKTKLSYLLKIISKYIVGKDWFRHHLGLFKLYVEIYRNLGLEDTLIKDMLLIIKNQNAMRSFVKDADYFSISSAIYDFLMHTEYSSLMEGFRDIE